MSDLTARLRAALPPDLPPRLGVAVSGGGDSVALLYALAGLLDRSRLSAVTVDHNLRADSAAEAAGVSALCARLGVTHDTLIWKDGPTAGNLQAQAREARYDLIANWARRKGLDAVALGHTQDDQAETVLMRLARGAGVTGLAAMRPVRVDRDITWLRPMLGISRLDLRGYLTAQGVRWTDDPSNEDTRFDRIRLRGAMDDLAALGLTAAALSDVADNMARAGEALSFQARTAAARLGRTHLGDILLDRNMLRDEPQDIARRLLLRAITCVAGPGYAPRAAAVMRVLQDGLNGRNATLGGCLFLVQKGDLRVTREWAAVRGHHGSGPVWDRWHLDGLQKGDRISALGEEGLSQVPDWRAVGAPFEALLATPGIWRDGRLIAAPVAGWSGGVFATNLRAGHWISLN